MTDQAKSRRAAAAMALTVAACGWAVSPIFIRLLSGAYEPFSQAFIRYASATAAMFAFCLISHRSELVRLLRSPWTLMGLAAIAAFQQWTWTAACFDSPPVIASLTSKVSVVFVIFFSFCFFREERQVIRDPFFLWGACASFVGVYFVLSDSTVSLSAFLHSSSFLLILAAFLFSLYLIWGRHCVRNTHPIPMFTVIALFITLELGLAMLKLGRPEMLLTASAGATTVAVVSGIICIGGCHSCYHYAQKHLGAALCSTLSLLNPLVTFAIGSMIWPDEKFEGIQYVGAGVLLCGALLVTWASQRTHGRERKRADETQITATEEAQELL